MPLKDRDRNVPKRLVRLGIIRLGHKEERVTDKGRKYSFPVQDDHFVLTDAQDLVPVYGDKPTVLDVLLPYDDPWRNFDASYMVWAGGVLVCKGDGEFVDYAMPHEIKYVPLRGKEGTRTSVRNAPGETLVVNGTAQAAFEWNGSEFQTGDQVPCPGARADAYPHCAACKASAVLKVMMSDPRLFRLGFYQISTGSGRNYDTILGVLELLYQSARRVSGIPFKLRLVEEATSYKDTNGKRKATTRHFLQLEPEPDFTRQLYARQAVLALGAGPEPEDHDQAPEFDEADEAAPPPIAEVDVDPETGEIYTDEEDAPWVEDEIEDPEPELEAAGDGAVAGTNPDALVAGDLFESAHAAKAAIKKSKVIDFSKPPALVVPWAKFYRGYRDAGMNSDQAVQAADTEMAVTVKA